MSRTRRWSTMLGGLLALALILPTQSMTGWLRGRGGAVDSYPMQRRVPLPGFCPFDGWLGLGPMTLVPIRVIALAAWGIARLFAGCRRRVEAGNTPVRARPAAAGAYKPNGAPARAAANLWPRHSAKSSPDADGIRRA